MTAPTTDDALCGLLDEGRSRAARLGPDHARLWEAVAAATEGGKRFRPALVLAAHDALGGRCPDAAARVGAAIELLHTAFVIHDDVIDGDEVRRGRPNVVGAFRSYADRAGALPGDAVDFGRSAGIRAGDLALTAAVRAVATSGAGPETTDRLLDLVDVALHTSAAGELADVWLSLDVETASLPESLAMEEQKTSAYSFALPLQAGALLAGADDQTVARLGEAGRALGVAFQLADDLLGVYGDPATTGKSATNDLRTRKQTPLLTHARTTADWPMISTYVGRALTEDELAEVRHLLTTSGSRRFVEDLAAAELAAGRTVVEQLGIPVDLLATLGLKQPVPLADDEVAA